MEQNTFSSIFSQLQSLAAGLILLEGKPSDISGSDLGLPPKTPFVAEALLLKDGSTVTLATMPELKVIVTGGAHPANILHSKLPDGRTTAFSCAAVANIQFHAFIVADYIPHGGVALPGVEIAAEGTENEKSRLLLGTEIPLEVQEEIVSLLLGMLREELGSETVAAPRGDVEYSAREIVQRVMDEAQITSIDIRQVLERVAGEALGAQGILHQVVQQRLKLQNFDKGGVAAPGRERILHVRLPDGIARRVAEQVEAASILFKR